MPFCPNCGYEYREVFTSCPNCRAPLVGTLPSSSESAIKNEPLAEVYLAPNQFLAADIKATLEAAGIPVIEQLGVSPMTYDSLDFSVKGYYARLLTFESRAEEAKRIVADFLAAYERGDLSLPE